MHEEAELSIHHSFWYFVSPTHWTTHSLCVAFITFFLITIPAYFIIGFLPARATAISRATDVSGDYLTIEDISLHEPVIDVELVDGHLATPDYEIGRYISTSGATFLFAHSITAFSHLHELTDDGHILYGDHTYRITDISTERVEGISMPDLLASSEDTLILMTCAGDLRAGDYTHRLIITAER